MVNVQGEPYGTTPPTTAYVIIQAFMWSFRKLGVPYSGVLIIIIRILLFRILSEGPLFSETPNINHSHNVKSRPCACEQSPKESPKAT